MKINSNVVAWFKASLGVGLVAGIVSCGGSSIESVIPPQTAATKFTTTSLVSDDTVPAANTDDNLVNARGIAFDPAGGVWIANNRTNTATFYDRDGVPQPLVVAIPPGAVGDANPNAIVFNSTQGFNVTQGGATAPSTIIVAGSGGTIAAWSPALNSGSAVTVFDGSANGSAYTGLAQASSGGANYLYAADFRNNRIDVFDTNFAKVTLAGDFSDPNLPAGYAPFGIRAFGDRIFVTYAQQGGTDGSRGAGLGVIDIFDTTGVLVNQFVVGGALNAPDSVAMAPADFGTFSNVVLVANFGDGKINAFDAQSGAALGPLSNPDGTPIEIDGLRGIAFFGNGNSLFFVAGPSNGNRGQLGRIDIAQ